MNVVMLNTSDIDGGAAKATYRLHKVIKSLGHESVYLVQSKKGIDKSVFGPIGKYNKLINFLRPYIDAFPLNLYKNRSINPWNVGWLRNNSMLRKIDKAYPDIIHLHWINAGYVPIRHIPKMGDKVVWTLHDSWSFTGGCNVPGNCMRYVESCGKCPQLNSNMNYDLSRAIWERKKKHYSQGNFTLVAPSKWMAECAGKSSLFYGKKIHIIPNGLDTDLFKPVDKEYSRELLHLPKEKNLILFGAMYSTEDKNKGFDLLIDSINKLNLSPNETEIVIFGGDDTSKTNNLKYKVHNLGHIHNEEMMVALYSAADVMCVPSRQESFGQTASESMSCGTPVVAFGATGLVDIVDHHKNGYLAEPFDTEDFSRGIEWILSHNINRDLSFSAREKVEKNFDIRITGKRYLELYEHLINQEKEMVQL
ncbi:glycosyltransferase family 4 protein [Neobacillus sp. NRS-1170]|uniref:glycosyltransferase family 4 protein n=1 Tax=Neobacillus sp. NRS-1170 TaxID=3233898 RepID=UPI003D2CF644